MNWKGHNISYKGIHTWVSKHFSKPKYCEICGIESGYDWANVSGKYLRDRKDWRYLCRKCHMESDGRMKNLKMNPCRGMLGKHHTEETKNKCRLINLGLKRSEETRQKIRESKIGRYAGKNNPFYGRKHSEETKAKISASKKKNNEWIIYKTTKAKINLNGK